jgi:hypothetical protein
LGLQGKRGIRIELGCSIADRSLLTPVLLGTIMSVSALLVPVDDIRAIGALSLSCLLPTLGCVVWTAIYYVAPKKRVAADLVWHTIKRAVGES